MESSSPSSDLCGRYLNIRLRNPRTKANGTLIGACGGTLAGGHIGSTFGGSTRALLGVGLDAVAGGLGVNLSEKDMDQTQ